MGRTIRNYTREHGRAKARKKFGNGIDTIPVYWEGQVVGSVSREWHGVYCTWTWKAVLTWEGLVHSYTSTVCSDRCVTWAEKKMKCLTKPEFGKNLKDLIESSGFSIVEVAEDIGCSKEVIYKWMAGHSHPGVSPLVRICKLLAVLEWEPLYTELSEIIELERC